MVVKKELVLYKGQNKNGFTMPTDEEEASKIFSADKTEYNERGDIVKEVPLYHMFNDMVTDEITEHIKNGGTVKVIFQ